MGERSEAVMSDAEARAFLREPGRTLTVATMNADGSIHLVAMWYAVLPAGELVFTAYHRSQKIINLRRNPQFSALTEAGRFYGELRGVRIGGRAELVDDPQVKLAAIGGMEMRYANTTPAAQMSETTLRKRIAVVLHVDRMSSWDHRKLGRDVAPVAQPAG